MSITKEDIIEAVTEADLDPDGSIRWGYSGRGMYGQECFGLVGSESEFGRFMVELTVLAGADEARQLVDCLCTDSMGRKIIFYFPGVEVASND